MTRHGSPVFNGGVVVQIFEVLTVVSEVKRVSKGLSRSHSVDCPRPFQYLVS